MAADGVAAAGAVDAAVGAAGAAAGAGAGFGGAGGADGIALFASLKRTTVGAAAPSQKSAMALT